MPWVPELFSAPVLARLLGKRRRDELVTVSYFYGLMAGELHALIESFAGEPELHHPIRGRIKGTRASEQYFTETTTSFEQRNVSVADVDRVITEARGFEEVIRHLEAAPELFMAPRSDRLRVAACPVLIDQ